MSMPHETDIRELLKQAIPPSNEVLQRDLWPQMLRRLGDKPLQRAVPWFDWVLAGSFVILICAYPEFIPLLLYHL